MPKNLTVALVVLVLSLPVEAPTAKDTVQVTEWTVPWPQTRPRDPFVDRHGRVWFVGQGGDYIASLTPATGQFERYMLDKGTGPHNLIVDDAGLVWYAGNRAAHIGMLNPADGGYIEKILMPDPAAKDPHTLVFSGSGDIWFTVQWGNFVGKLETRSKRVSLIPVPTSSARAYGIIVARNGTPWFTEFGTNKLACIDPEALSIREFVIPRRQARPRRLAETADGRVWYVDYAEGFLGALNAKTGQFSEFRVPGGSAAAPYGLAADDADRLWFVETGADPNRLVAFDAAANKFVSVTDIPSGAGAVRHMHFDPRLREIWFGTDANTIGRVRLTD